MVTNFSAEWRGKVKVRLFWLINIDFISVKYSLSAYQLFLHILILRRADEKHRLHKTYETPERIGLILQLSQKGG